MTALSRHPNAKAILHVVVPYVIFAGLWILFSDKLLANLVVDAASITRLSIYKGWAFVLVTALLLAFLLHLHLSERQRAYAALLEGERRYHELVDHANSIILRWSHDGRIISLNEYGQRFFGYTQEEICGRHVVGSIVPETESSGRDLKPLMDKICRNPAAFEQNVNENMRRNGEHVWIAWTNKVALDPQGKVTEVLSIGADITARKQMEEELRTTQAGLEQRVALRTRELAEREAFARALADEQELLLRNLQVGVLFSADGKILKVNPKLAEIFGFANPEELAGGDPRQLFPTTADFDHFMAAAGKVFAAGGVLDMESRGMRRDGSLFSGRTIASAIQAPGHRHASIWIIEDVSIRKEVEAALIEAKHAAESADRLKSAFLATMSHELRTPLNSIIGFTGLVLQELPGPLNGEQKKQLGMVQDSARHLLALINDVLDISKIEAGELQVTHDPFDLGASIDRVTGIITPLVEKKGLALKIEGRDQACTLTGDARRVEQILFNLLSNAIKFTEAGSITLAIRRVADHVPVKVAAPREAVRLKVSDTGMGIRPEDMAQLFLPFRQIDSAITRQHEGTGLGLAICRRLTALMGGIIEAESRFGEGSAFTVTLPLAATEIA